MKLSFYLANARHSLVVADFHQMAADFSAIVNNTNQPIADDGMGGARLQMRGLYVENFSSQLEKIENYRVCWERV